MRSPPAVVALTLVGALALAACGGDVAGVGTADEPAATPSGAVDDVATPDGPPLATTSSAAADPPGPDPRDPDAPRVPTGEPVTLALAGDTHFEGVVAQNLAADPSGEGVVGPLAATLAAADVAVVNLETAITGRGTPAPKEFTFRAPPTALDALVDAGVDVVTLANNHGFDYGEQGLLDTLDAAEAAGLPLVGGGRDAAEAYAPHVVQVRGRRVGVIGATQVLDSFAVEGWRARAGVPGLASAKESGLPDLLASVRSTRPDVDTLVVFLHWGRERDRCPLERQPVLADELVEAGADVVVGAHAHVLAGGGWRDDGAYVDYGLGNFVFYARPGVGAYSGVLELTVEGRAVTGARWVPASISGGRPLPVEGDRAAEVLAEKDRARTGCTDLAAEPPAVAPGAGTGPRDGAGG